MVPRRQEATPVPKGVLRRVARQLARALSSEGLPYTAAAIKFAPRTGQRMKSRDGPQRSERCIEHAHSHRQHLSPANGRKD
eukprot:5546862-Prymnesium_polylepis.1